MTSLVLTHNTGLLAGSDVPGAGALSQKVREITLSALIGLKTERRAGSSLVFNDLQSLASECGVDVHQCKVFFLAQRFLLALPSYLPSPELAMDTDGEILFDWQGARGRLLTVSLREDGRLSYAARISAFDKDHGTKRFTDAVPKQLIELVQRIADQ